MKSLSFKFFHLDNVPNSIDIILRFLGKKRRILIKKHNDEINSITLTEFSGVTI